MEFTSWHPLTSEGIVALPKLPAAFQVRRETGLVEYPRGKSAMLFYGYADVNLYETVSKLFPLDEMADGHPQHGALLVRFSTEVEAKPEMKALYQSFTRRFGQPVLEKELL